MNFGKV